MKEQIKQIEAVRDGLSKITVPSRYQESAISALNSAKDNLTWHVEAEEKAAKEAAAAAKTEPKK
jgi:hypothetical protein